MSIPGLDLLHCFYLSRWTCWARLWCG